MRNKYSYIFTVIFASLNTIITKLQKKNTKNKSYNQHYKQYSRTERSLYGNIGSKGWGVLDLKARMNLLIPFFNHMSYAISRLAHLLKYR
jgi:hypothetical protein